MSIPEMSSNTTPSGVAAASSVQGTGVAWRAFDRLTGTAWQTTSLNSGWLSYNFPSGKVIKRYGFFTFVTLGRNPRTWTFEGSNDGSTWTTLDTQTNFVTGVSTFYSFDISANTTSYTYYRINITAVQTLGQIIEIAELEMSEVTNLYGGTVAGGSFNFNSGSISGSATSGLGLGATNLITVTATTGSVSLMLGGAVAANSSTTWIMFNHSGNCNFNLSGTSFTAANAGIGGIINLISKSSPGTITISGSILTGINGGSGMNVLSSTNGNTIINGNIVPNQGSGITQTAGNLTVNGTVTGGSSGGGTGLVFTGTSITVNGNVVGGSATNALAVSTTAPVNIINGTVTGGTAAAISSTTANQINISGSVVASANAVGVSSTNASGIVILNGNITNNAGKQAIYCQNLFLSDTGTTQAQFFTSGSQDRTLYSANTFPNLPSSSIVRSTTLYGPGNELSGSLIMPDPANVRYGVLTDNTTGSALLSAQSLFDEIATSTNPVAVRLRKSSTTDTFGNMLTAFKK
jgi:hypothetical protein